MRKFLVVKNTCENFKLTHMEIRGFVESDTYPSTIVNDHEYSLREYGVEYADVIEVTEKCHIKLF